VMARFRSHPSFFDPFLVSLHPLMLLRCSYSGSYSGPSGLLFTLSLNESIILTIIAIFIFDIRSSSDRGER